MPFLCAEPEHPHLQRAATSALMAVMYFCYCAVVRFATSEGAGWQFFMLALSSAIPALAFLCILNAMYLSQWKRSKTVHTVATIILDILSIALMASQVDYNNIVNMEF
ncbi:MAG: hypothetical protein J6C67_02005 [Muribaculaceae bacterium]|nr:hypothetical protein [Muribaculaceae bacterium]